VLAGTLSPPPVVREITHHPPWQGPSTLPCDVASAPHLRNAKAFRDAPARPKAGAFRTRPGRRAPLLSHAPTERGTVVL
jgi:hypothetical protein